MDRSGLQELAYDVGQGRVGEPDREVSCGDAQSVLIYDDPAKRARIADFYRVDR